MQAIPPKPSFFGEGVRSGQEGFDCNIGRLSSEVFWPLDFVGPFGSAAQIFFPGIGLVFDLSLSIRWRIYVTHLALDGVDLGFRQALKVIPFAYLVAIFTLAQFGLRPAVGIA